MQKLIDDMEKKEKIFGLLQHKAGLKQAIYRNTLDRFEEFKMILSGIQQELSTAITAIDKNVEISVHNRSSFESELKFSGDILVFSMHTNVFSFDHAHFIHQSPYVQKDLINSFCGKIDIYNFLADSYKYSRLNDIGYLLGRIFINHENHFFVEGKKQLGFLYGDFANQVLTTQSIRDIIETSMLYALEFDLMAPPFDAVREISLGQKLMEQGNAGLITGKRLGFNSED